jgi:hypothetical protein
LWANPEKSERTRYIKDPETWPIVVRIFTAIADGVPVLRLARELEAEGAPTPFQVLEARGQLPAGRTASPIWRRSQIRRIIHHPAYWGEHSAYRFQHTAIKIRPAETGITRKVWRVSERDVDNPDRVALPDACPPLVSKELAERAQARLHQNKAESAGRNPDPLATLFRGMVVCGHCGGRMFTSARSGTSEGEGRLYKCSRRADGGNLSRRRSQHPIQRA